MMKEVALCLSILGIFLLLFLLSSEPKEIGDLNNTLINQKVIIEGIVDKERTAGELVIMVINGIEVVCSCEESYMGKSVSLVGVVSEFNGKKQVKVLRIKEQALQQ